MIMATDEATKADDRPKGIPCPRCGCCHHRVRNSVKLRDGKVRRYRYCRHCGKQIVTTESANDAYG